MQLPVVVWETDILRTVVIAIIAGSVGVLSGKTNNKCVYSDAGLFVLAGIMACGCFACIIGLSIMCRDMTKCCVKKSDRVDVNRPDVMPPANEEVVNPANRPATKAPEHRPPTKAIPLPDMFFTA
ncbi:uncharacterized protein [Apostichopus japonicus]|uniref:uncharacterized protein isoform X2 n=1 Tax=Stichopus japonicus TaxID=307972 RepID=UPI003AB33ECD